MDGPVSLTRRTCDRCGEAILPGYSECWKCAGGGEEDPPPPAAEPSADIPSIFGPAEVSKKNLWLEVGVVLAVAWLPAFCHALWDLLDPMPPGNSIEDSFGILLRSFVVVVPVLYIMGRSGSGFGHFGLGRPRWILDGLLICLILILNLGLQVHFGLLVNVLFPDRPFDFPMPSRNAEHVLLVASCCANGFAEEMVMRGYLIPRLEKLFNSTSEAVLLSALLFASYHIYQGAAATVLILVMGFLFGFAFAAIRRVWPLAAAHALWGLAVVYLR